MTSYHRRVRRTELNGWWKIGIPIVIPLVRVLFRVQVEGSQNIPVTGGAILAFNHVSVLDGPVLAAEIALRIRESGKTIKSENGTSIKVPGSLKSVKAMGVYLERHKISQVSINLTNYHVTPPHMAFEEVKREAGKLGISVTGSEIVGLIPKEALLMAGGFFYHEKTSATTEQQLIERAVAALGLSQLEPFDPKKKVIEYMI